MNAVSFRTGDLVTFPGVDAVNMVDKTLMHRRRTFVITKDGPFDEGHIYPPIITDGPRRNVVGRPDELQPERYGR